MLGRMSKLVHQEVEAAKAAVGVRRDCRCSHACMDPLHGPFTWSPTSHAWSPTSLTLKCVSSDSTGPSEGSDVGEEGLWGIQGRAVPIGEGGACMGVCMSVCMSAGYLCEWRKFSWDKCVGIPTVKVASMCTRRSSLPHGRDSKSHMVGCMTLRSLAVGVGIMHVCEGDRGDQIKTYHDENFAPSSVHMAHTDRTEHTVHTCMTVSSASPVPHSRCVSLFPSVSSGPEIMWPLHRRCGLSEAAQGQGPEGQPLSASDMPWFRIYIYRNWTD